MKRNTNRRLKIKMIKNKKILNKKINFNLIIIISILFTFLVLSGCSLTSLVHKNATENSFGNIEGSNTKNYPFGEILIPSLKNRNSLNENEKFELIYKIYNPSDFNLINVKYKLSGFDPGFITYGNAQNIQGDIQKIPGKIMNRINFKAINIGPIAFGKFEDTYTPLFRFTVCYEHNPIYASKNYNMPAVDSYKNFPPVIFNQNGLPLKITFTDAINEGNNKVQFDFTIKNQGNGKVIKSCFDTNEEYSVIVKITTFEVGGIKGECHDSYDNSKIGEVELRGGEGAFTCTFTRSVTNEYQTQIKMGLSYLYQFNTDKKVTIKNPRIIQN